MCVFFVFFFSEIWLNSSQVQESTIAECIASSLYLISLFHHRLDQLSCPKQVDPTICFHFISAELSQKWQLTNPFQMLEIHKPSDNFKMFFPIFFLQFSSSFKRQPFWPPRCSSLPPFSRLRGPDSQLQPIHPRADLWGKRSNGETVRFFQWNSPVIWVVPQKIRVFPQIIHESIKK